VLSGDIFGLYKNRMGNVSLLYKKGFEKIVDLLVSDILW